MAIPIRRCGKDTVPDYLLKFKVTTAAGEQGQSDAAGEQGQSENPIMDRFPMNFAGPETGSFWNRRSVEDRRRGNGVVKSIFGRIGEQGTLAKGGLFANFSYGQEDPGFPMEYLKDLFKYHPDLRLLKGKAATREVFMPKDSITNLNENYVYGLRERTPEDLEYMICGKLDLVLVRIAVLAHSMGKKNTIFELNIQAEAGGFLNPKTDEGAMFLNPLEYETRLSDKLFELFDKKALIAHGQPVESSVELPVLTFPGVVDTGLPWPLVVKAFRDFSVNYSEAMKTYIYALADKAVEDFQQVILFTKPDKTPNEDRYISMRSQHMLHADLPEASLVRKEYFAGRIKKDSRGSSIREALFVDLDNIEAAWINKSRGILASSFTNMLHEIEVYSRNAASEYDPEQTLSQYGDTRTIVFTNKYCTGKADRPGGEISSIDDKITKIPFEPITQEEARDVKIPHFLMSNLFGEEIERGPKVQLHDKVLFAFKIPIKRGAGERRAEEIAKLGLSHLKDQRGDLVYEEIENLKTNRDIQMIPFIWKDVERLDRVADLELTDDEKSRAISRLFNDIIVKANQDFRYLDPWERDNDGNLIDEESVPINLTSGKVNGKISKDGTMLIGTKEMGFFKYKHNGGSATGENANPLVGLWENISTEVKADSITSYQLEQNGEGKAVYSDKEYNLVWFASDSKEQIVISIIELLPKVPQFSKEMKEKIREMTNLSSGLSFKSMQRFLQQTLWDSVERNEDDSEKREVVVVDKNYNYVYRSEEDPLEEGNVKKKPYISNYKEFSRMMAQNYITHLFEATGGENAGQQQAVFSAFTQEQIQARYVITQEELKSVTENYKYIGKAESWMDNLQKYSKGRKKPKEEDEKKMVDEEKKNFLNMMKETNPDFGLSSIGIRENTWNSISDIETLNKIIKQFTSKTKRNTFLLHGPSGTGKTTFALHLANMLNYGCISWNLEKTKGKYVGDTENNLTVAFDRIKNLRNQVLVLDEVDGVIGKNPSQDGDPGAKAIEDAFLKSIDEVRLFLVKNNVILVSTTNHKDLIEERHLRRLIGQGKEGGTTEAIELKAPTEMADIQNLVSLYVENKAIDAWPNRDEFARAYSEALAKKAKEKQPFAPYEIGTLLDKWSEPGIRVRDLNIDAYITNENKKTFGPGETKELRTQKIEEWTRRKEEYAYGPKSIVRMVEKTIPSSAAATKNGTISGFSFAPNAKEANSAAFLLGIQQIAVEPSPGIGGPAVPATPPKRKIPWGTTEEEDDDEGTSDAPIPPAEVPGIPADPKVQVPSVFPIRSITREKTGGRLGSFNRSKTRSSFNRSKTRSSFNLGKG